MSEVVSKKVSKVSAPIPVQDVEAKSGLLAVVRIRSAVDSTIEIRDTLSMLHLEKKNACVVLKDTPSIRGMIVRVGPYVTWGSVSPEMIEKIKHRLIGKSVYGLHPPRGGFERKGIKVPFKVGGALGFRGSMDALLERMS